MVNAIIWEFQEPLNSEEQSFALSYFRQIHYLHCIQEIYVPSNVLSSIASVLSIKDNFIKITPSAGKEEKRALKGLATSLDTFLWKMKKRDIYESGLTSFLTAFETWLMAQKHEAVIVVPFSNPTSVFSRLVHLLVGDQRENISCLSEDIELWLFSRFAEISAESPYFLDFSLRIANAIGNDVELRKYHRELSDLRNQYLFNTEKRDLVNYEKRLTRFQVCQGRMAYHLSQEFPGQIINTKVSLAPSRKNMEMLRNSKWKCDFLGTIMKQVKMESNFTPFFLNFDFYPSEIMKSLRQPAALNTAVNPLAYAQAFKIAGKAELELAMANYKERLDD